MLDEDPDFMHETAITRNDKGKGKERMAIQTGHHHSRDRVKESAMKLVWTKTENVRLSTILDNSDKDMRVTKALLLGDLWEANPVRVQDPRLFLLGYCRDHQGEVRGELYSGYIYTSLQPLKTRKIFSPTGEVEGTIEDDSSPSPSVATISELPASDDIELSVRVVIRKLSTHRLKHPQPPQGPPMSDSPSSQTMPSILRLQEGGPVIVPDELDPEIEMEKVVIPESNDIFDDLELEYPMRETPAVEDGGTDVLREFCRFDSVIPHAS